jgi:hypothetical protein
MVVENLDPMIKVVIYITVVVGVANVCLLVSLLRTYWKTYKEVKSQFTIGLLYFTSFLLIQNVLVTIAMGIPLLLPVLPFPVPDSDFVRPHFALLFINLIQLVALSILYRITKE